MHFRSIISIALAVSLSVPLAHARLFTDTATSVYQHDIEELAQRGIIRGYGDGTYRPNTTINRAEFLSILMDSRFPQRQPIDRGCFTDLNVRMPQWYARTTCAARELGIVQGYPDGSFRPERPVQFDEALAMAFHAFGIWVPQATGAWYEPYLSTARQYNILTQFLSSPAHLMTRGEMAALTIRLIDIADRENLNPIPSTSVCGNGNVEGAEQCDDGNNLDGDGCSSICILVPEPVRIAILQVDQESTGVLSTVARGQKNVSLLKFSVVAGRQDARLTRLAFRPSVGSLLYGQHYTLAMDRNNDGVYETIAQDYGRTTSSSLVFDELSHGGIDIPMGLRVRFLVRADITASQGPVSLGLEFATNEPDYIEAHGLIDGIDLTGIETNGLCPSGGCFIRVNTIGTTNINVQQAGNVYVTQDTLPVRSHLLLAGSETDELLRLLFRADSEDIDLQTLRIDGVPSSVESLVLYRVSPGEKAHGLPFAQATHGQCPEQSSTRFCIDLSQNTFVISPTRETVIVVKARLKNDQNGAVSGQTMTLSVSSSTSASSSAVQARGISSQQSLAQNDNDAAAEGEIFVGTSGQERNSSITGVSHDIALANISRVFNDGPQLTPYIPVGQSVIGSFGIGAYPHTNTAYGQNDVVLTRMTFTVTAQNIQFDPATFTLSAREDPAATVPCSGAQTTGTFTVTCTLTSGSIRQRIGQGQVASYRLSATITNPQLAPTTSILRVDLPVLGQRTITNSILWSDEDTSFSWVDIPETSVSGTEYRR